MDGRDGSKVGAWKGIPTIRSVLPKGLYSVPVIILLNALENSAEGEEDENKDKSRVVESGPI